MFDVAGARQEGYSDEQIVSYLAKSGKLAFDFAGAAKEGYSPSEMLDAIAAKSEAKDTSIASAPAAGAGSFVSGVGKTLKQFTPFTDAAAALEKTGESLQPKNYESAQVYSKEKGLDVSELPRKVAESAPGAAVGIAAARVTPGPWWLKALSGASTYLASQAGNRAEERAASEGGDPENPTTKQKAIGLGTAAAESVPAALGVSRFLPGAGGVATRTGAAGVSDAVKRAATTAGIEGATGASQSAIADAGTTIGTEGGLKIDPAKAIDAGLGNAAMSPVFSGPRTAREISEARKYSGFDPATSKLVANDLTTAAGGKLDPKSGYDAVNALETNYRVDLNNAVKAFEKTAPLTGEAQGVVERAKQGQKLTERDLNIIDNITATVPGGDVLAQSVRKSNTLSQLKTTGDFNQQNQKFVGGLGGKMERNVRAIANPVAAGTGAGLVASGISSAGMLSYTPHALGAVASTYLAARGLDKALGNRSPVKQFVERFGGPVSGPTPPTPPAGPLSPPLPGGGPGSPWGMRPAMGGSPTGPRVAPCCRRLRQRPRQRYPPPAPYAAGPGTTGPIPQPPPAAMPLLPPPRGPASAMRTPTAPINQPMEQRPALPAPQSIEMPDQSGQPALPAPLRDLLPVIRRLQLPAQPTENPIARGLGLETVRRATEPQPDTQARPGDEVVAEADRLRAQMAKSQPKEDLDAGTRARIASLKAQTEALRAKGASADYTPSKVSMPGPMEMPDIPDFLRRTKEAPSTTPAASVLSAEPAKAPVETPKKRPVAVSALAAKIAAQHNAEVNAEKNRKPVVQDAPVAPAAQGKPLSMVEEMNHEAVLDAVKNGATTLKDVRKQLRGSIDPSDLDATVTRMRNEGAIAVDSNGKVALPGKASASEVMSSALQAKAEEPAKSSDHYVPGKADETVRNIINSEWIDKKGFQPHEPIRKGIERIVLAKHGAADAVKEATGVDIGSQLIKAGTRVEGRAIRDKLVEQHPDAREAIYKVLNEGAIQNIWKKEGGPTKAQREATLNDTLQARFVSKVGKENIIPDANLRPDYANQLTKHNGDNAAFDKVIEKLKADRSVTQVQMRALATHFLGFEPAKGKGRGDLLKEIVNWQALDARQRARISSSSNPGALSVSEHTRMADDLLARMTATNGRTAG
jgi:hypothetical protein